MDIREHMQVVDAEGHHVGVVDKVEDDRIKLTKMDRPDRQHHFVDKSEIVGVEGNKVKLSWKLPASPA